MLLPHERSLQPGLVDAGLIVPVAGLVGSRDPDPSSSAKHPGPASAEETELQCHGSPNLCWAVSFGAEYRQGADDCEAGHRDPLAPRRLQIVLALEIAAPLRSTDRAIGNSPVDPRGERRQPVVGGAAHPW